MLGRPLYRERSGHISASLHYILTVGHSEGRGEEDATHVKYYSFLGFISGGLVELSGPGRRPSPQSDSQVFQVIKTQHPHVTLYFSSGQVWSGQVRSVA